MAPAERPRQRPLGARLFLVTVTITAGWALPGAVLCHAVYESSAQPGGAGIGRPWPANAWTILLFVMAVPAVAASPAPVAAAVLGQRYLSRIARVTWPWQVAWVATAAVAAVTQLLLLRGVVLYASHHGRLPGSGPPPAGHGPSELAAGFVLDGAVMLALLSGAAAKARSRDGGPK